MAPQRTTDVAVVGAGPAGATIARLLALRGLRVALLDSELMVDRLEVLAPSSMNVLQALQLDEVVSDPTIGRPCSGIRRHWNSRTPQFDDFFAMPGGRGYVVDRTRFDSVLRAKAEAAGAEVVIGRAKSVARGPSIFDITVQTGDEAKIVSAPLIVDATGRPASIARRLGGTHMMAEHLVAEREHVESSRETSQEPVWLDIRSCGTFWTYSTSGPDGRRESWTIRRAGESRVPRRNAVNVSSACLDRAAGQGWIAIGDAAAAFDPIASQGLVNALASAMVAAGALLEAGDMTADAAAGYSAAVISTFMYSEEGRAGVYRAVRKD